VTLTPEARRVFFGPGRVRVTGLGPRGIVVAPPPAPSPGGQGHGAHGGQGQAHGGGHGKGRSGGNSLAAALGAVSATGGKVLPSSDVGTTWFSGAGAPVAQLGVLNDWYVDLSNRDVYLKASAITVPSFMGAAAWSATASGSTISMTMPSGAIAGEMLVMVLSTIDAAQVSAPIVTTPAGWQRFINGETYDFHATGSVYAFWKIAVGADPSVTVAIDRSSFSHGSVSRYANANTATPINATGQGADTRPTVTTGAVATTVTNCLIVSYGIVVAAPVVPWAGVPAGITSRGFDNTAAGRVNGQQFGDIQASAATTYGPYAWTPSTAGSQPTYGVTIALAPAAAAAVWTREGALAA
jgi:hypothetical protein